MSSIVIAGDTSGSVTLQAPAVAGATILTLPATSGTVQTSGAGYTTNGVAFASSTSVLATGSALTFNGSSATPILTFTKTTSATFSGLNFVFSSATSSVTVNDSTGEMRFASGTNSSGYFQTFLTDGSERMRLTSAGSLVVGGTEVVTNNGGITATTTSSGSVQATLAMRNAGTGNGSGTTLAFRGATNTGAENDYAYITMVADNTTSKTGSMRFSTGNGTTPAERMRIDPAGNLLVGTTTKNNDGRLSISADSAANQGISIKNLNGANNLTYVLFTNSSDNTAGSILHTGSTTVSYVTSSDYRLKENIFPMTGALARVGQLKPCTYTWKEDGSAGQGFIAHELQEFVPDCVTGKKDALDKNGNPEYQGIDTSFLVATLTAAIQELKAEFDAYKASHP